jgi:hypothetical protein
MTLKQILDLVGKLDDTTGEDTPRQRFRRFLKENVKEVGQLRDYVEECLRGKGDQYNRALQDLVNYIGEFLGFEVNFGRYQGVQNQIGFDGHWISSKGFHVVVEVKTTETYAIKTAAIVGYVDALISEKTIPNWDSALGLYVVGRPDPQIKQLENAIVAEKRGHQLRVVSVESLLSMAEMMNGYDVSHQDMLGVIRPSGPTIDAVVDLMARLVGQKETEDEQPPASVVHDNAAPRSRQDITYWLTPVKSNKDQTAAEVIQLLVGEEKIYAFGERTPGRKHLKPGDEICFYETAKGVVANAQVATKPEKRPHTKVRSKEIYPWTFKLSAAKLYLSNPIVIDADLRSRLDAFRGRDAAKSWAWFVQATSRISEHDFKILTRQLSHG